MICVTIYHFVLLFNCDFCVPICHFMLLFNSCDLFTSVTFLCYFFKTIWFVSICYSLYYCSTTVTGLLLWRFITFSKLYDLSTSVTMLPFNSCDWFTSVYHFFKNVWFVSLYSSLCFCLTAVVCLLLSHLCYIFKAIWFEYFC